MASGTTAPALPLIRESAFHDGKNVLSKLTPNDQHVRVGCKRGFELSQEKANGEYWT
jgi:hypothetical protein